MPQAEVSQFRILLAEDDKEDRLFLQEAASFLQADTKINVDCVRDGVELMHTLLSPNLVAPDVIFLDINMPLKNGLECLHEIRNHPELENIPVIIFTTSQRESEIDEAYDAGANIYLIKPHAFPALTEMLRKISQMDWKHQRPSLWRDEFVWRN
jgi:CheY-like chemotaxis protein